VHHQVGGQPAPTGADPATRPAPAAPLQTPVPAKGDKPLTSADTAAPAPVAVSAESAGRPAIALER
jgi:hypothetical protein